MKIPQPVHRFSIVPLMFWIGTAVGFAEDWPRWRGPSGHGVWTESGIVDRFPDDGLRVSWRVPIRGGFAGPVVAGGGCSY